MAATIKIKNSSTAGAAPTSSDLVQGELAVNVTDKRLFTENASGTVVELGTNPSSITLPDGSASAPTLLHSGDTNTGLFFPAADTIAWTTGGTERLRLDSSGNLGLGVTPSTWGSNFLALQAGSGSALWAQKNAPATFVSSNTYYDGTNFKYISSNQASYYQQANAAHLWFNAASGTAGNNITFTQAMTLDASGNFLVGTTTAREQLTVNSAGYFAGDFNNANAANGLYVSGNSSGVSQIRGYNTSGGVLAFYTNAAAGSGVERARIASGGQFCVNTTNTNGAFNVSGNVYLFSQSSGAGNSTLKWNSGTGQVTYDTSSRLVKDNIVDSPYGLAEVMQLKSRKYFRTDDQREEIGLVADEVQTVLPEFVPMSPKSIFTGDEADTELVPSGVYYEKLSSVLIKAIQEQQAIIEQLQADVAALKG